MAEGYIPDLHINHLNITNLKGPSGFVRGFLIAFKHLKSFEQKHAEPAKAPF